MKLKLALLILLLGAVRFACAAATQSQVDPGVLSFAESQSAPRANDREEELYSDATENLNDEEYSDAIKGFDEVAKMHGRRADAALYWKAYAQNKDGQKERALATIAELRKSYPKGKWLQEAGALEIEIRSSLHQQVNPDAQSDEELKVYALNALMNSDQERAIPVLEKVLQGNNSRKMKDKALFVLAQGNSEKGQQILLNIAKNNNDPELQRKAIQYIGMFGGGRNRSILRDIYNSATDVSVKKAVFQGWLMSGAKEDVLAVAKNEKSPEMRKEAFRYLGMMGGRAELHQLYSQSDSADTKQALLQAMGINGDAEGIYEIAKADSDPAVRKKAINNLGIFGGSAGTGMLVNLYNSPIDTQSKKEVINALFLHGAAKDMVALARKETNPELKSAWLQKLSLMHSPEITDYMMEILNK
jgi:HEAT repeat protein